MQEWIYECEKKGNKQKNGKWFYKLNNFDSRLTVAY